MIIPFHQHRGLPRLVMVSQQAVADLAYDPPPGVPRSTAFRSRMACAFVMLGRSRVCLTTDGDDLALVEHRSAVKDFYDQDELRRVYYPEAERLVAEATGGSRVRRQPVGLRQGSGKVVSLV
ncbi:MAG: hypothetical protein ACJ8AH_10400 [Stellaceae bacterium]